MQWFTRPFARLRFYLFRKVIGAIARPKIAGQYPADSKPPSPATNAADLVYVLEHRAYSDLVILDLVCADLGLPSPLANIRFSDDHQEDRRFFSLYRPSGWFRRRSMLTHSERFLRILNDVPVAALGNVALQPVAVYWSRAPQREGSVWRQLISENWDMTSRFRRFLNLLINRRDIVVHFGNPLALAELKQNANSMHNNAPQRLVRRAARLLRVRFRNQRLASMGPNFSHVRTFYDQIINSRGVRTAIINHDSKKSEKALIRQARSNALEVMANFSYPSVRVIERLLRWFWQQIYAGVELNGLERMSELTQGHTVIYVPSHRSHVDYLLMAYLLFQRGMMIPHTIAGDNLNVPIVGGILRRGGAIFMRRSFRDDPLYAAVFNEYLYQVYRRGHSVEFFPEGGRTRTGRLLPARLGLLKTTLEHHKRGISHPTALVPVFFGYEKLIEASSYLAELQGAKKRKESFTDLIRSLKLIRQNFGKVTVNIGQPILLDDWTEQHRAATPRANKNPDAVEALTRQLGHDVMLGINASAALNPVSLVALVILATPRLALPSLDLARQIDCYLSLLQADAAHHDYSLPVKDGTECIAYVAQLQLITLEDAEFGNVASFDTFTAILMTWYRNNVLHTLALPALLACLLLKRRRPLALEQIKSITDAVYPFIADELAVVDDPSGCERWLKHLSEVNLLRETDGGYQPPDTVSAEFAQLEMLAQMLMPTLERMFIVVGLVTREAKPLLAREPLLEQSLFTAKKMARLYGLNAPEFFDRKLFDGFISALIDKGYLVQDTDETLRAEPNLHRIMRAASAVIDSRYRQAVLRSN